MAIYPDVISSLIADCNAYALRNLDLDTLKARVWNASRMIVAHEESGLRELLMRSEGELDSIQFTSDDDMIFERALEVVKPLQTVLTANLAEGST